MTLQWAILFVVAFFQNMTFTWSSRSRAGGDPSYHRVAAMCSNGVWFITQLFVLNTVLPALLKGDWMQILATATIYIIATSEGSVLAMKLLLKTETGKRKVGAV